MAATCFKPACTIYCLIWIITLSFLFGITHVEVTYSYVHDEGVLHLYMRSACSAVIVLAILGCCCIKCDVTHVCCIFWYMVVTLVLTMGLCGALLLHLRYPPKYVDSAFDVLRAIKSSWPEIPLYLDNTQKHYGCCGLFGYKDYRAFIYPESYDGNDVPISCCGPNKNPDYPDSCILENNASEPLKNLFNDTGVPAPNKLPINIPRKLTAKQKEDLIRIIRELYGDNATIKFKQEAYFFGDRAFAGEAWLFPNVTKKGNYNEEGCFSTLRSKGLSIHNYYYGFCFFLMAAAVLMSVLLVQNCLKARRLVQENAAVSSSITSEVKADINTAGKVDAVQNQGKKEGVTAT